MQLALTEDQELLAKTAADFAAERSPVSRVRQLRDAGDPDGFSRALWKEMAELGWVGIPFPESYGGADMGLAELAVVLEALGAHLAPEPFLSTVLLGGRALLLGGSDAQRDAWLPGLVEGDKLLALANHERHSRFDLARVETRAEVEGDVWRIHGEKTAVLEGSSADAFMVAARTSGAAAGFRSNRAPPVAGEHAGKNRLALRLPTFIAAGFSRRCKPVRKHGGMHRRDKRHRRIPTGQRAQCLADDARRAADAFPKSTLLDRYADQQIARIAQGIEIGPSERASQLSLGPLPGKTRR